MKPESLTCVVLRCACGCAIARVLHVPKRAYVVLTLVLSRKGREPGRDLDSETGLARLGRDCLGLLTIAQSPS